MGHEHVKVDWTQIDKAAKELDAFGQDLKSETAAMQRKVESFGDPFGGDEIGMLIGITHQVVSEFGFEKLTELADDMVADGEAAAHIAKTLRENEEAGSEVIDTIATEV